MARLVFDASLLARNVRGFSEAARSSGVTALFAMKSFPHAHMRALAAELLDGCDAASPDEVAAARGAVLSVADPSGRAVEAARGWPGRLIVSCETSAQVRAAPANAEIALRVSASITGTDPAVGAVLDGTGHRRSRFGIEDRAELRALFDAAAGRPVGLHVHHGPITSTWSGRFVATARAALDLADFSPRFINLGGAWHGLSDLATAFRDLRAALPADLELLAEPGRALVEGAGFARGTVMVARDLAGRPLRVLDLSRICHLRWSQVELVHRAPHPGEGRRALFLGPTCFEEDVVGEWTITPSQFPAGAPVILRGVTGYAVAWNTGFAGVPAAEVVIGDADRLLE